MFETAWKEIYTWITWFDPISGVLTFFVALAGTVGTFVIRRLLKKNISQSAIIYKLENDVNYWKSEFTKAEHLHASASADLRERSSSDPVAVNLRAEEALEDGDAVRAFSLAEEYFAKNGTELAKLCDIIADTHLASIATDRARSLRRALRYTAVAETFGGQSSALRSEIISALDELPSSAETEDDQDVFFEISSVGGKSLSESDLDLMMTEAFIAIRHGWNHTARRLFRRIKAYSRSNRTDRQRLTHYAASGMLADCHITLKDFKGAKSELEYVQSIADPDNPEAKVQILSQFSKLALAEGDRRKADEFALLAGIAAAEVYGLYSRNLVPIRFTVAIACAGHDLVDIAAELWAFNVEVLAQEGESPIDLLVNVESLVQANSALHRLAHSESIIERFRSVRSTNEHTEEIFDRIQRNHVFGFDFQRDRHLSKIKLKRCATKLIPVSPS